MTGWFLKGARRVVSSLVCVTGMLSSGKRDATDPLPSRETLSDSHSLAVAVVAVSYIVQGLLYPLKCSETPSGL